MSIISRIMLAFGMAVLLGTALPVFAESAPVYDIDSGFDNVPADQTQDLPPPPPPGQEGGAFVPPQQQDLVSSAPAPRRSLPPAPSLSMDQRVQRMEQQIDNIQNGDSAERINSLQNQVQSLRGQLEQLTHQIQQLQSQQKSQYSDLDKRLTQQSASISRKKATASLDKTDTADGQIIENDKLSKASPVAISSKLANHKKIKIASKSAESPKIAATKSNDQPDVAEEQAIYQTAYNMIKAKKYDDAVHTLQGMLKKYPSGQFASNAHYWLGELYGLMNKNDQALTEFGTVVKAFPDSPRISDAQLKVGLILAAQSKWVDAKAVFKKVMSRYPGTASARLAAENLKQIKQAGH